MSAPVRLPSARSLLLAATLAAAMLWPSTSLAAAPDGSLIAVGPHVYRVVGGAPLHITRCDYTGGCAGVQAVPSLDGYRATPRDGALVANVDDGGIYRFAGGAALWLGSCDYPPGCASVHTVDGGTFAELDHMRQYPADGTLVGNQADGGVYRFAGGAPLWISSCDYGPGCAGVVPVDGGTFLRAGSLIPGQPHMRQFPADGTLIGTVADGSVYRFAGGAPLWLSRCEEPACAAAVQVDGGTLGRLGTITPGQPHMRRAPVDGTYLHVPDGARYRVAGASPLRVSDCAPLDGGCAGSVAVDAGTLRQLDRSQLRAVPEDGTALKGLPSGAFWTVAGGAAVPGPASPSAVGINDDTIRALEHSPGAPTGQPGTPAKQRRIRATVRFTFLWRGHRTLFETLVVRGVPKGATVTVRCRHRSCPRRRFARVGDGKPVRLRPYVRKPLRKGVRLDIRVTRGDRQGVQKVLLVRGRRAPRLITRCLGVGATGGTKRC